MKSTRMSKAVSSSLPMFLAVAAISILALYSFYTLSISILTIVSASRSIQRWDLVISIESLDVYSNGSIRMVLSVDRGSSAYDLRSLDVVVSYTDAASGRSFTYVLLPNVSWWIEGVCVKGTAICFDRSYVRPGEVAILRGSLPTLSVGSWGYVAIVTSGGYSIEKAFAVGE